LKFSYLAGFAFLLSQAALAYIPPGGYIVSTWVKKRSNLKTIRIESNVAATDGDQPSSSVHFHETTFYNAQTGQVRSIAKDDFGHELYRVDRANHEFSPPSKILLDPRSVEVIHYIKERGIPIVMETAKNDADEANPKSGESTALTLKRWKTQNAWVLGLKNAPQLWVEKDTFLPLRLTADSNSAETEFEGYRFQREVPYPHTVLITLKNLPVMRDDLVEVQINPKFVDELKGPSVPGFTEYANSSAPQPIKDLIQHYYEWIR